MSDPMQSNHTARGLRITVWIFLATCTFTTASIWILSEIEGYIEGYDSHFTGYPSQLGTFDYYLLFSGIFAIISTIFSSQYSRPYIKAATVTGLSLLFAFNALNIYLDISLDTSSGSDGFTIYLAIACAIALPAVIMHLVVIIVACVSRPRDSASQVVYPTPQTTQPMPQQYSPQQPTYQPWN